MLSTKENREPEAIKIRASVLGSIARLAALETKGVIGMSLKPWRRLLGTLGFGKFDEGVRVKFKESDIKLTTSLLVEYGADIPLVASAVADNVKKAIEKMTGITSLDIVVDVRGVVKAKSQ